MNEMNLLATVNENYIPPLLGMMRSAVRANPGRRLHLYLVHAGLAAHCIDYLHLQAGAIGFDFTQLWMDAAQLEGAPISKQFPREMYFRIFAARLLPQTLERVLYLDPDLVVLRPLDDLYELELGNSFLAAAAHMNEYTQVLNNLRLDTPLGNAYFNSGVLLLNLQLLRAEQDTAEVLRFIEENHARLLMPDQDILNALYGDRTILIDPLVYNFDARYYHIMKQMGRLDSEWLRQNTAILHFCGKSKPWLKSYRNQTLKSVYLRASAGLEPFAEGEALCAPNKP